MVVTFSGKCLIPFENFAFVAIRFLSLFEIAINNYLGSAHKTVKAAKFPLVFGMLFLVLPIGCAHLNSSTKNLSESETTPQNEKAGESLGPMVHVQGFAVEAGGEVYDGEEIITYMKSKGEMQAADLASQAWDERNQARSSWTGDALIGLGDGVLGGLVGSNVYVAQAHDPGVDAYGFGRAIVVIGCGVGGFLAGTVYGVAHSIFYGQPLAMQDLDKAVDKFNQSQKKTRDFPHN